MLSGRDASSTRMASTVSITRCSGSYRDYTLTIFGCCSSSRNTCSLRGLVIWAYMRVF